MLRRLTTTALFFSLTLAGASAFAEDEDEQTEVQAQTQRDQAASSLSGALERDHDGSILDSSREDGDDEGDDFDWEEAETGYSPAERATLRD